MDYKNKYLEYKSKYINLQKQLLGGAPKNIIFGCTTLHYEDSTFVKNYDLINAEINKLIPIDEIKISHFVIDYENDKIRESHIMPDELVMTKMRENNYIIQEHINTLPIIDYINNEFKHNKVDILVFAQCNDLVSSFINNKSYLHLKYTDIFNLCEKNIFDLYNSLKGYIINIYYTETLFSNIEYNITVSTLHIIHMHNICSQLFNKLFVLVDPNIKGVYKKIDGITYDSYMIFSKEIYDTTMSRFFAIIKNNDPINKKIDDILSNFLPIDYDLPIGIELQKRLITKVIDKYNK